MPDKSKFKKLREVGYQVVVTCGLCKHSGFTKPGKDWSNCTKHKYDHEKHDNPEGGRGVSVFLPAGTCADAELCSSKASQLGAHAEFLP